MFLEMLTFIPLAASYFYCKIKRIYYISIENSNTIFTKVTMKQLLD